MHVAADNMFLSNPDPMWIYALDTLCFLAVNDAAVAQYGYSRDEFLAMNISDIRPPEDRAALQKSVEAVVGGRDEAGVWRHCLKSGELIYVDITGHTVEYDGLRAELISARNVSRLVVAEQIAREALEREKLARKTSETLASQFQIMFDSVPGFFLVFSPDNFDLVAVSDAFLTLLNLKRPDVVARNLFDVLPLQPGDKTHGSLRGSFDRVLATGKSNVLELQKFVMNGNEERFWTVFTSPVAGPDERLLHLIVRIQDVTDVIHSGDAGSASLKNSGLESSKVDLFAHTRELKSDNIRLGELATRLRTTQRLLGTGTWDYVIAEDRLIWSNNVYGMYGVTFEQFGHRFEDYIALVHPDDRAVIRTSFDTFMMSHDAYFSFAHQIVHPDGRIAHVRGVAERTDAPEGQMLRGVVQDVTHGTEVASTLAQAKRMLDIAGTSAKFGAWRYDADSDLLEWSPQTARILDEPDGFSPTVADAIAYYRPENRDWIATQFRSCLEDGVPFDETLQITTAKGRRIWVRATGEAERDENGRVISIHGSFQDVSELATVRQRAEESEMLLKIAGRAVKLGGWRVSLTDRTVSWTDGVAAIHELPPGTKPTYEGGIDYFAPEEQEAARKVFEACARDGIPFNNVRELITAKGNRVEVRSLGEPVRDASGKIIAVQGAMQDISELTAARREVDELSTRLAETLENIGDAFFMIDADCRFTYLNSKAEFLLERTRNELLGRTVHDEFPDIAGSEFETQYTRAFKTGQTVRFEQFFAPLDRIFRVNAHPMPKGLAIYFSDITEERRRDEQLRLLDAAVGQINDIVIITEADKADTANDSKIIYVNDAFERLTGFTREEAIGQTPRILQGPNTQRSELDRIRKAVTRLTPVRAELINYTKKGREYWLEIDIVPIANKTGSVTHLVAVQRDITDRRRGEEALRISETRFRLIAQATGNAVWEWDIKNERLWWSDAMVEMLGHRPESQAMMRTVWRESVHPDDLNRVAESLDRLMSGQADSAHDRYRFRRADGIWADAEDRAFLIRDDQGQPIRVLGSMTDISERLEMEDRLRQSQKLEAIGQLTGGVAHDFNNLLTIIMGNTELLQEELADGHPLRAYTDMSATAANRAAELTNRLLAFSRKQALQPRVININAVVAGVEEMLGRTLGEDIDIEVILEDGLWLTEVDLGQLETSLLNLAVNSRDAMPDGGALTIETANVVLDHDYVSDEPNLTPGHYVVIAVSDTGLGISKGQIHRVVEPFFTTKPVGMGTGLGLSMVYGFVKQTGGHIRIYSELNEGTTVKMYFPKFLGDQLTSDVAIKETISKGGQETILVVEDDDLILQQLVTQLSGLGYTVIPTSAGGPALAILHERSDIDLLFTDVVLPGGMNGRQIADAALVKRPGMKVLFTSGYSENTIVHHGRLDPEVELLNKPYRRSELAAKVRKVLDS